MKQATTITATREAQELIGQLRSAHGRLSFHVSGSYGVTVTCLAEGELQTGARDVLLGTVDGVPLYMMTSELIHWQGSVLVLDVARGVAAGFSLEGPRGIHFTLRKRADPAKRIWDADAVLAAGPPPAHSLKDRNS